MPFTVRRTVDHLATVDELWRTSRAAYVDDALSLYLDENEALAQAQDGEISCRRG